MAEKPRDTRANEHLRRLPRQREARAGALNDRVYGVLAVLDRSHRAGIEIVKLGLSDTLKVFDNSVISHIGELPPHGLEVISWDTAYAVSGQFTVSDTGEVNLETLPSGGHASRVIRLTNVTRDEAVRFREFGDKVVGGIVKIYGNDQSTNGYVGSIANKVFVKPRLGQS